MQKATNCREYLKYVRSVYEAFFSAKASSAYWNIKPVCKIKYKSSDNLREHKLLGVDRHISAIFSKKSGIKNETPKAVYGIKWLLNK